MHLIRLIVYMKSQLKIKIMLYEDKFALFYNDYKSVEDIGNEYLNEESVSI
jgi:hypothetical protein